MKTFLNSTIMLIALISLPTFATQIGRTYPIAEVDLEQLMKARSSTLANPKSFDVKKATAFKGVYLPKTVKESERTFTPFYTLEFDLLGKNGEVLYPKGFTFNPAAYSKIPGTIWVFDDSQVEFIRPLIKTGDTLLLSSGDVFEASNQLGTKIYLLDQAIVTRLSLRSVPSRVKQVGAQYQVWEAVDHD